MMRMAGKVLAVLAVLTAGLLGGPVAGAASSSPTSACLERELPGATAAGSGSYRWFGLKIYDATLLLGPAGYRQGSPPLALELRYARNLQGSKIASASIDEIRKLGLGSSAQQAQWLAKMEALFPDVRDGSRIAGIWSAGGAQFCLDGEPLGSIADPAFAQAFFAIWLDPRTSAPGLREELLRGATSK